MAGGIWGNFNAVYRMCGVEINRFDQRECGQVILLGIEGGALIRGGGRIANTDIILDEPLVDCLAEV